ncbi:hypothetical protein [Sphingorhabdus lutea]|nr:hypothetical protein [Sphingorhabdus lutea]
MLVDKDNLIRSVKLPQSLWDKLDRMVAAGFLDPTDFLDTIWRPVSDHPNASKWLSRCIMYADFTWQTERREPTNDNYSPMIEFSALMVMSDCS